MQDVLETIVCLFSGFAAGIFFAELMAKCEKSAAPKRKPKPKPRERLWIALQPFKGPAAGHLFAVVYLEGDEIQADFAMIRMVAAVEDEACCGKGQA